MARSHILYESKVSYMYIVLLYTLFVVTVSPFRWYNFLTAAFKRVANLVDVYCMLFIFILLLLSS